MTHAMLFGENPSDILSLGGSHMLFVWGAWERHMLLLLLFLYDAVCWEKYVVLLVCRETHMCLFVGGVGGGGGEDRNHVVLFV